MKFDGAFENKIYSKVIHSFIIIITRIHQCIRVEVIRQTFCVEPLVRKHFNQIVLYQNDLKYIYVLYIYTVAAAVGAVTAVAAALIDTKQKLLNSL